VLKQYGIKIVVLITGRLGVFSFNTLLIQLAAGSALLGVGILLTDSIALYLLPERKLYTEAKFMNTQDFGDYRQRLREEAGSKYRGEGETGAESNGSSNDNSYGSGEASDGAQEQSFGGKQRDEGVAEQESGQVSRPGKIASV
jgi:hypothetical protein